MQVYYYLNVAEWGDGQPGVSPNWSSSPVLNLVNKLIGLND